MRPSSIKSPMSSIIAVCVLSAALPGCSSVDKVVREDQPTMEQIYNQYAGNDEQAAFEQRKRELQLRDANSQPPSGQLDFPASAKQLQALYPKLPNPDLYMYVRPHAVGQTGAPVPGYMTRFGLYERDQYALPGESVETLRRNAVVDAAQAAEARERELAQAEKARRESDREALKRYKPQGNHGGI